MYFLWRMKETTLKKENFLLRNQVPLSLHLKTKEKGCCSLCAGVSVGGRYYYKVRSPKDAIARLQYAKRNLGEASSLHHCIHCFAYFIFSVMPANKPKLNY